MTLHLLERLLTFDPQRRTSAEEALVHEFFAHHDAGLGAPWVPWN